MRHPSQSQCEMNISPTLKFPPKKSCKVLPFSAITLLIGLQPPQWNPCIFKGSLACPRDFACHLCIADWRALCPGPYPSSYEQKNIFSRGPIWMFPKIVVPQMDGKNNGKTLLKWDDLGGFPLFLETPIYFGSTPHPVTVANEGLVRDSLLKMQ